MSVNKIPEDDLRDAIIYFVKERRVSIPHILENVDISRSRLYDYLQGNGKISATTFANIIITIGVTSDEIITHMLRVNRDLVPHLLSDLNLVGDERIAPNKQTIDNVIEAFEETGDINLLKELANGILTLVPDRDQQRRLMDILVPTVSHAYRKRRFYTVADSVLFSNIMPFLDYEDAKQIANSINDQVDEFRAVDGYGVDAVNKVLYDFQHVFGLVHMNLLRMALDNDDTDGVEISIKRIEQYDLLRPDYYYGVVKHAAEVIELVLNEDYISAEKLYNQTVDAIEFILADKFAGAFRKILLKNFDMFIAPAQNYLDRK